VGGARDREARGGRDGFVRVRLSDELRRW